MVTRPLIDYIDYEECIDGCLKIIIYFPKSVITTIATIDVTNTATITSTRERAFECFNFLIDILLLKIGLR